jgi:hypothetical protein
VKVYLSENGYLLSQIAGWNELKVYLADTGVRFKSAHDEKLRGAESNDNLLCQAYSQTEKSGLGGEIFKGTSILQSFYYCDSFTEKVIIPNCENFLLDSGAFTFMSSTKKAVDWNEYLRKYIDFINRNKVTHFFELDIDTVIGYERVKELRRTLENGTGKPCIPVWHKTRGMDEYYRMCEQYNYIAIGGIVSKEIVPQEYKYFPKFIKIAHDNGAKIHGLGFTNLQGLTKYHFDSVDSTTWTTGNRFGQVYTFDGKTVVQSKRKEGTRIADHKAIALHNFTEWVKFQKYAEKYL